MIPPVVTVWLAITTCPTCGAGNGASSAAAEPGITAAPTSAATSRSFLMVSSPRRLLGQRAGELDGELAGAAVEAARELERPLRVQQLPGRLQDGGLADDAERLAGLVAAALRDGQDLECDRAGGAGHLPGAVERDARLLRTVALADARDLPGADQRA